MDDGVAAVEEPEIDAQLKRQARRVYLKAVVLAGALTLIALTIPGR